MQLQWHKCALSAWCVLSEIDVAKIEGRGVFIIWRNGDPRRAPAVLYVGHGELRHALERCRRDPLFHGAPQVHVTWADVADVLDIEPIATYLYQQLRPIWGEVLPASPKPVPVNLPLSA